MASAPVLSILLGLTNILNSNFEPINHGGVIQKALGGKIEDFPFQVSLRVSDEHKCSGSILSESKILTAAHCVFNVPVEKLSIRVGSSKHFDGETYKVRLATIHPTFNQTNLDRDVAMLTLTNDLTFGPRVKSIELAMQGLFDGSLAYVTGWGEISEGVNVTPDNLKVATVRLISADSCRAWYPNNVITKGMVCADNIEFGTNSCQFDAGSPLLDKSTGKQVGIVSWTGGCSHPALPTVYAAVSVLIALNDS